jgi:hypothetical protein
MQASYYYMGHFSRFIPPGSRRVALHNSVETKVPELSANDVKNGQVGAARRSRTLDRNPKSSA